MNEQVAKVRHANARKILQRNCDGKVKAFAQKIGKSNQQCSNILRTKNPAKIGSTLARQIESAFEYPANWMDVEFHNSIDETNLKMKQRFASMDEAVRTLANLAFEGIASHDAIVFNEFGHDHIEKLQKTLRSVQFDLLQTCHKKLLATLKLAGFYINGDTKKSHHTVTTSNAVFSIITCKDMGHYHSYPITPSCYSLESTAFEVFPITVDGKFELLILEDKTPLPGFADMNCYRAYQSMIKNQSQFLEPSSEIIQFINSNPLMMELSKDKKSE